MVAVAGKNGMATGAASDGAGGVQVMMQVAAYMAMQLDTQIM